MRRFRATNVNILSCNDLRIGRHGLATVAAALALLTAISVPAQAQSLNAGDLAGVARDGSGHTLPETNITLTERVTGVVRTRLTARDGRFAFSLLQPGEYTLLVERFGYRPRFLVGLPVRAGSVVDLDVVLEDANRGTGIDTAVYSGVAPGGLHLNLGDRTVDALASLADPAGLITGAAVLLPGGSDDQTAQGLPGRLGAFAPDAAIRRAPHHPLLPSGWLDGLAFPQMVMHGIQLLPGGMDAEWSGSGGGLLSGFTVPGSRNFSATLTALGGPTSQSASAVIGGPAVRDTAQYAFGLAVSRLNPQLAAPWGRDSTAAGYVATAADSFTTDLSAYQRSYKPVFMNIAGFGRFDWIVARDHRLTLRADAASATVDDAVLAADLPASLGSTLKARDLSAAALLTSTLGAHAGNEFSLGFDAGSRDYAGAPGAGTQFVAGGFASGGSTAMPGTFKRTSFRVGDTGHLRFAHGALKLGFQARVNSFDQTFAENRAGRFLFGDSLHFAADSGAFVQTVGTLPVASFKTTALGGFVQLQLRPTSGLELTGGLRYDYQKIPAGDLRGNSDWLKLTGIDNRAVTGSRSLIAPRGRLAWTPSASRSWLIAVDAGRFLEADDPGELAEALAYATGVSVRRGVGSFGAWPAIPDSTIAPVRGTTLSLLGPRYSPPITSRAGLGLSGNVRGMNLRFEVAYRHTDYLPLRRDLNLALPGGARDQDGRAIYGTLVKSGGLVLAAPGSNRRFNTFDQVFALDPAAASNNVAFTVAFDRLVGSGIRLLAEYTWSRTTDNWFGARAASLQAQVVPFADSTGFSAWAKGRSDFDVPHRLVVGLNIPVRGATLTALYRLRSGYPFTPGFRDGVDVNGDGSGQNDPAFVSDTVTGAAELVAANACLRAQLGRVSERNACREPMVGGLDLRFAVQLRRTARGGAQLLVDALDLVATGRDVTDHAMYLVDPAGSLTTTAGGVTRIPLLGNPNFGKVLWKRTPPATVRVGVRLEL